LVDRFLDGIELVVDLGIPKAQHIPTFAFQESGSVGIGPFAYQVRFSIDFDHEQARHAGEIDHLPTDGMLPTKLETCQGAIAQRLPKQGFRGDSILSQFTSQVGAFRSLGHFDPPSLLPLSPHRLRFCQSRIVAGGGRGEPEDCLLPSESGAPGQ
jgi:hypothetical protein